MKLSFIFLKNKLSPPNFVFHQRRRSLNKVCSCFPQVPGPLPLHLHRPGRGRPDDRHGLRAGRPAHPRPHARAEAEAGHGGGRGRREAGRELQAQGQVQVCGMGGFVCLSLAPGDAGCLFRNMVWGLFFLPR